MPLIALYLCSGKMKKVVSYSVNRRLQFASCSCRSRRIDALRSDVL